MSKKPGDGFYPSIDRKYCPNCGKKGCYKKHVEDIPESYKCYYCRQWSYTETVINYQPTLKLKDNGKLCKIKGKQPTH